MAFRNRNNKASIIFSNFSLLAWGGCFLLFFFFSPFSQKIRFQISHRGLGKFWGAEDTSEPSCEGNASELSKENDAPSPRRLCELRSLSKAASRDPGVTDPGHSADLGIDCPPLHYREEFLRNDGELDTNEVFQNQIHTQEASKKLFKKKVKEKNVHYNMFQQQQEK